MFAINHTVTALVIKKYYPSVPMVWLLISVQLVDILWITFHFVGIEHTSTEAVVSTISDIHMWHMPYSHSIFSSLVLAFFAWIVVDKIFGHRKVAIAISLGILAHTGLDVLTHTQDMPLAPFLATKIGLGLYDIPLAAFAVETIYWIACWRIFGGSKGLLAVILAFNLGNLPTFSYSISGFEAQMANQPILIVTSVAVQTAISFILVWFLSRERSLVLERNAA